MTLFINKNGNLTAANARVAYEYAFNKPQVGDAIIRTWLKGGPASLAIEALIISTPKVCSRIELEANDSDIMRLSQDQPRVLTRL